MNPALTLRRLVWVPLALFFPVAASSARTWTDREGRGIEAEFVRMEGDGKVVINKGGKEFVIPLAKLSDSDRQWLKEKDADHDKATGDTGSPEGTAQDKTSLQGAEAFDEASDHALKSMRSGNKMSASEKRACQRTFKSLSDALREKHEVANYQWPEPDRTEYFKEAMKMAIIDPEQHAGWPFRSTLRHRVLPELKKRIGTNDDPFLRFCAVFPALGSGDTAYAVSSYEKIRSADEFLADRILLWSVSYYQNPTWISSYYKSKDDADNASKVEKDLVAAVFPDGMKKASLADFNGKPRAGYVFLGENQTMRNFGLEEGMVVVALDGYRVSDRSQYIIVRGLNGNNPEMDLVVWNGKKFIEVAVDIPGGRWGVRMETYLR